MVPDQFLKNILAKLLVIEFEHDRKISVLTSFGLGCDPLYVDLLRVVLDALGVPPDNTVEQEKKYGMHGADVHPDTHCRDGFTCRWFDLCCACMETDSLTIDDAYAYIDWVIADQMRVRELTTTKQEMQTAACQGGCRVCGDD